MKFNIKPIENCLFICKKNLNFIYFLDNSLINKRWKKLNELFFNNKKIFPKDSEIYKIILRSNENFYFLIQRVYHEKFILQQSLPDVRKPNNILDFLGHWIGTKFRRQK